MPSGSLEKAGDGEGLLRTTGNFLAMRVLFWTWIVLITAGLAFYSVIGLTHH